MLTYEQKVLVNNRVKHFIELANEQYDVEIEMPNVRFDKRGRVGGTAAYLAHELNFNAGLMVDNWDEYMNQVIPHEVAHLVKFRVYGNDRNGRRNGPHGTLWQNIMRGFGCEPDRCHTMDTSKVAQHQTKHLYKCSCCEKEIVVGPKIHRKIVNGHGGYGHKGCRGSSLIFSRTAGKVSYVEAREKANGPKVPPLAKKPTPAPRPAPKAKTKRVGGEPKPGTKIAHALVIYQAMRKTTDNRQDIISAIANSMQITKHQAAGYYQNCKKKVG